MYGLIHGALRDMVEQQCPPGTWAEISSLAGIDQSQMLTMRAYDDAITFKLVGAASQVLDMEIEESLNTFGRFWIADFAPRGYDQLMNLTGSTMVQFLKNLNELHDRISTTFCDFRPPRFDIEVVGDGEIEVHYRSDRAGLTPFVAGLLEGLRDRFEEPCSIELKETMATSDGEHSVFQLLSEGGFDV